MTTTRVRLLAVSFSIALFAFSAPLFAATGVRIVRLSLAQGDVQIDRNAGEGWEQAITNMPVIGGARLYAAENSKAELELEDGSSIRLVGPAQISMTELSTTPKGSPVNVIQVQSGEVYVNARLHHHDDFRLVGPTGETFAITQPSQLRFTVDQQTASLALTTGEAVVQSDQGKSTIRTGETYNYVLGQPDSAVRQAEVRPDDQDTWNQQRETYNDQYASAGAAPQPPAAAPNSADNTAAQNSNAQDSNAPNAQDSNAQDPNTAAQEDTTAPGTADLGYYGTYADLPGYGVAWQPNGVGPDWDPFGYGAWSYYPGWGWTFVSGYPWGWAPFYYGDWCYINGRGWWWRPGGGRPGHGPFHGPHNPGNGGWHAQPHFTNHPLTAWSAPHPPANTAAHVTVALAGSHLNAGPIAQTHSPSAAHANGFAPGVSNGVASGAGSSIHIPATHSPVTHGTALRAPSATQGFTSGARATSTPSTRVGTTTITGRPGSYSVTGPAIHRNGFEVHRPPNSSPRTFTYNGATQGTTTQPHTYAYEGTAREGTASPAITSAPRSESAPTSSYAAPSAPIQHAPSAPSVSSAPHASSAPAPSSGGGSHFGGGGGGLSGGGGFHGGGGGGHR